MTNLQDPLFRSRRYILRERGREDLVRRFANVSGWVEAAERPANKRQTTGRTVIWEIIPGLTVGYYDEPFAEASCLVVHSVRDPAEVREFEAILRQNLNFLKESDLLSAFSESTPRTRGQILALIRLGLGAPLSFDERYFEQLSASARSDNPDVRIAALHGITYTEWPEFRSTLRDIAAGDSKRSIRKLAGQILSVFDRLGLENES